MTNRERFEAWVSAPPFEKSVSRLPMDGNVTAWPGHYRDIAVQLAWEAWQEAQQYDDDYHGICADCGSEIELVRPGKHQCPKCG